MYPVPRLAGQFIDDWAGPLAERFGCSAEALREHPGEWLTFPRDTVRIELMDGSSAEFRYAFFLVCETGKCIAVFTEHCGYHLFPYHEARVFRNGDVAYVQAG